MAETIYDPRKQLSPDDPNRVAIIWNSINVGWAKDAIKNGIELKKSPFFDGNVNLRKGEIVFQRTEIEIREFVKCASSLLYFAKFHAKLRTVDDDGLSHTNLVKLYKYQVRQLKAFENAILKRDFDRFILLWSRQAAKTTTTAIFMAWCLCFFTEFQIAVLANKSKTSEEVVSKTKDIFSNLDFHLQPGVMNWNLSGFVLDSLSKITAFPCTFDSINGRSINVLYVDEFAYCCDGDAEKQSEFLSQAAPVVAATKGIIILSSTPNGRDLFFELYDRATKKLNSYFHSTVYWWDIPGRDQKWADKQIAEFGIDKFRVQFELQFDVESNKLFSVECLQRLNEVSKKFIQQYDIKPYETYKNSFKFGFDDLNFKEIYAILCYDIAEGLGLDSSVIQFFKLGHELDAKGRIKMFFEQFGLFDSNTVSIEQFAEISLQTINTFDQSKIRKLVEWNTYGDYYAKCLETIEEDEEFYEMDVDEAVWMKFKRSADAKHAIRGLRTNSGIKKIGVRAAKSCIERGVIRITHDETIEQAKHFNKDKKGNYQADVGHDDLITPILHLATTIAMKPVALIELVEDYLEDNNIDCDDWYFDVKLSDMDITKIQRYDGNGDE